MRKTMTATTALTAAILTLGTAGPATAATATATDPDDISHGVDLRAVEVRHGSRDLVVTTSHTDLRRDFRSGSAGAVYIDTDREDAGPEVVFVGGYFEGTDYQFLHTEGFGHQRWGAPVEGSYEMTVDYTQDQVRMRMARTALGNPGAVRVAVRVSGSRTDGSSHGLVDWLGKPGGFTRWVAKG